MNVHTEQQPEVIAGAGHRLRIAREKAGLSVAEVAERLHMPLRVVHSLESDDWSCLGAPVFVRGQLRSYARLLGLVTEPVLQASGVAPVAPVTLTPRTYTPKMRLWAEHAARRSVYAVLTLVIALPVWLAMQPQFRKDSSEVAPLDGAQSHPQPASGSAAQSQAPLIASRTAGSLSSSIQSTICRGSIFPKIGLSSTARTRSVRPWVRICSRDHS